MSSKWVNGCQEDNCTGMATQTGTITLAMTDNWDWWHPFSPLLGYWFYMVRMCWVVDN